MAKCPKCNCEDYDVIYIEDHDYIGDEIILTVKVKCNDCGEEFWVREKYEFKNSTNI